MEELTLRQMLQIAHALGIDLFNAAMSHKLKDSQRNFTAIGFKRNMMKYLKN